MQNRVKRNKENWTSEGLRNRHFAVEGKTWQFNVQQQLVLFIMKKYIVMEIRIKKSLNHLCKFMSV